MSFEQLFESMYERGGMERSVYQQVLDDPKFQRWFKGSQVVDDDGIPFPCYHGTSADIKKFDHKKGDHFGIHFGTYNQADNRMTNLDTERAKQGENVDDPDELLGATPGSNVTPVFLKITNPLLMADVSGWDNASMIAYSLWTELDWRGEELRKVYDPEPGHDKNKQHMEILRGLIKAKGYDGIQYANLYEADSTEDEAHRLAYSWIVFDSNQIKSAIANKGTYDDSDNMLERRKQ